MVDLRKQTHDEIARMLDAQGLGQNDYLTPEIKQADDNIEFEKRVIDDPVKPGIGTVNVFGCETWDINAILKGNYWGRTIYTTDKICKLFLKWNIARQKKYLEKKNPLGFDYTWLLLLVTTVRSVKKEYEL